MELKRPQILINGFSWFLEKKFVYFKPGKNMIIINFSKMGMDFESRAPRITYASRTTVTLCSIEPVNF